MDHPTHVIVIGASAGGMPALCQLVAQLPADLPAAVLIVQHFAPDSSGEHLVDRLSRQTDLRCLLPQGGELIEPNTVYLAPPDRHLLVKDGYILVTKGPHENHYRPAADALFRSAAAYYGPNVIGWCSPACSTTARPAWSSSSAAGPDGGAGPARGRVSEHARECAQQRRHRLCGAVEGNGIFAHPPDPHALS
ncbi:chemotaxis protein CheB [Hymenobacter cellulosilyticus]|uniref:chemotaxis protein CheB n=1 Tax=Hymenobacter cellulosilyticus TaxID=2932248 RepID=UPI0021D43BAE|nr:chemotaxis protein CheB [Hymenobacter cellulosilyticus]